MGCWEKDHSVTLEAGTYKIETVNYSSGSVSFLVVTGGDKLKKGRSFRILDSIPHNHGPLTITFGKPPIFGRWGKPKHLATRSSMQSSWLNDERLEDALNYAS